MVLSRLLSTRRVILLLGLGLVAGVVHALLVPGNSIVVGGGVTQAVASGITFVLIRRRARAEGRDPGLFVQLGWALRALLWPVSYPREVAREHGWAVARADVGRLLLLLFGVVLAALVGLAAVRELA